MHPTLFTLGLTMQEIESDLAEGLQLMVVGMSIVFASLVVIGLMIKAATWLIRDAEVAEAEPPDASAPMPVATTQASGVEPGLSPQLLAVLAAAATAAVKRPVRVHRVRPLTNQDNQTWVYAARAGTHRQPAYRKGRI